MNPVEAEIIQQERKERMADSKTGDKREPSRDTVRDLRRYSCMIEDADDRELIQHAADMLEVAYRPSAPSAKLTIDPQFLECVNDSRYSNEWVGIAFRNRLNTGTLYVKVPE